MSTPSAELSLYEEKQSPGTGSHIAEEGPIKKSVVDEREEDSDAETIIAEGVELGLPLSKGKENDPEGDSELDGEAVTDDEE